jgi:hypothetical protein
MLRQGQQQLRGGALVKILKIMALVVLMGLTGSVALADGGGLSDPTVTVNKKGDPLCNADGSTPTGADYVCFTTNSQTDPITVPTGTTVNYVLASGSLDELWVEVLPTAPGSIYTCQGGDIFSMCGAVGAANQGGSEFVFFDGLLTANTELQAAAPEPKGLLLLLAGLVPLVAFRKRIAAALNS